jgi:hypothetical protein
MTDAEASGALETMMIDLGPVSVTLAVSAGPRVLAYAREGGPNLFASLPDDVIEHPAIGTYRFLGGHRLWRAPEVPAVSYVPDDAPVTITETDAGVEIVAPPDGDGIVKAIALSQHGEFTVVEHELRNEGWSPVRSAPWAITQLAPGGTAYLPQRREPVDDDGVLPNRHLVLWPYTDLSSSEITVRSDVITIEASDRPAKLKIGVSNRRGWIAYVRGTELFVKWAALHRDGDVYADYGASVQCYRDERFLELETLGPLVTLQPGKRASHREVWVLRDVSGDGLDDALESLPAAPEGLAP